MFFFSSRRRHTRLTCDWSSDVCSSDLSALGTTAPAGSKTWPRSVPVVRCANADAEKSSAVAVTNSAKTTLLRPLTWYRQALLNVALSQFMCPLHSIGQTQTSHCSAWRNLKQTLSRQSDSP